MEWVREGEKEKGGRGGSMKGRTLSLNTVITPHGQSLLYSMLVMRQGPNGWRNSPEWMHSAVNVCIMFWAKKFPLRGLLAADQTDIGIF